MTFIFGSWRSYDGCSAMTHRTSTTSWFALMNGKPLRSYSLSMTWTNEPLRTIMNLLVLICFLMMVCVCVCDPWLGACPEFDAKSWTDADQHGRTGWKAIWRKRCRWCSGYVRCFYADDLCVKKSEAAQYERKIYQCFDLLRLFHGISTLVALVLLSFGGGNLSSWLDSWWIQWHRSHGCLLDHCQVWTWEHQLTKLSS